MLKTSVRRQSKNLPGKKTSPTSYTVTNKVPCLVLLLSASSGFSVLQHKGLTLLYSIPKNKSAVTPDPQKDLTYNAS